MAGVLERVPRGAGVAVLRLRSLGDCVLTTPALEILKRSRPDLRVAVAVEARFAAVFRGNPDVELILDPDPWSVRRFGARLCVNLHGGTRSAWMTALSGSRFRAGFGHFRFGALYNVKIPRAQQILETGRKVHTAEHLASAMFFLGCPAVEIPPARLFPPHPRPPADYAVIHPAASRSDKTWPAARFLELAARLRFDFSLDPVFIGAGAAELAPFSGFRTLSGAPLGEVMDLLAGAAVFAGNDSGPAHMAAALRVPSVVLFGPSDPGIWGPWKTRAEAITAGDMNSIPTSQVLAALARLRECA
jgi:heptosyltransferase III